MTMTHDVQHWADDVAGRLFEAARNRLPIPNLAVLGLCDEASPLSLAYEAQRALIAQHLAGGDRPVGYKVAVTQRSKLAALGLQAPIVGRLLATAAVADEGKMHAADLIRPRIEPEIAFVLERALEGPHCTVADVARAVAYVTPAFEILDARYEPGPFHVFSAVADNVSSARHVLSPAQFNPAALDLPRVGCVLYRNGEVAGTGAGAQVLGHPAQSVVALVNDLATRGERLEAGSIVLTGGLIEATPVRAGEHLRASFHGMGDVSVSFV